MKRFCAMLFITAFFFLFSALFSHTNAQQGGGGGGGTCFTQGQYYCCNSYCINITNGSQCFWAPGAPDGGVCYETQTGGGGGGPAPGPSCRALNQSCSPPGGKAGQGNCCSGKTCVPSGKGGGTCKNNGCGAEGKTGSDYANGCCAGFSPDGKGVCQCTTPNPPYNLSPNGAVCPSTQNLSYSGGSQYYVRVNDPSNGGWNAGVCEGPSNPAGKDGVGDECFIDTNNSQPYNFVAGRTYNWWVHIKNPNCSAYGNPTYATAVVSTQPTAPSNLRPTGNIGPGARNILWTASSNADANTRYNLYIDDEQNGWNGSCSSPLAGDSCALNRTTTSYSYNFQSGRNYHLWVNATSCSYPASAQADAFVSVPPPYPTIAIQGNLREYSGGACYDNISTTSRALSLQPQNSQGVTTNCGVTPAAGSDPNVLASYRCTATFDVIANPTPAQNLTIQYSTTEYKPPYLTDANSCASSGTSSIAVNVAAPTPTTTFNKDLVFKPAGPWVKIRNGSFASAQNIANPIPNTISAYDSEDDASQRYLIMNSTGNVSGTAVAQGLNIGTANVSSDDWKATGYQKTNTLTFSSYFDYVKARKEYKKITNSDLSEVTSNGIYVWDGSGDLTLDDSNEGRLTGKVVLISSGEINITEDFTPTGSVGVFADIISFAGDPSPVAQAKGLFVANTINTGETTDQGLKITGNFVAQTLNNDRYWVANDKPTIFVSFSPSLFIDLLPWASISKYEYRQTQ